MPKIRDGSAFAALHRRRGYFLPLRLIHAIEAALHVAISASVITPLYTQPSPSCPPPPPYEPCTVPLNDVGGMGAEGAPTAATAAAVAAAGIRITTAVAAAVPIAAAVAVAAAVVVTAVVHGGAKIIGVGYALSCLIARDRCYVVGLRIGADVGTGLRIHVAAWRDVAAGGCRGKSKCAKNQH